MTYAPSLKQVSNKIMEKKKHSIILIVFFLFLSMVLVGCKNLSIDKNSINDINNSEKETQNNDGVENMSIKMTIENKNVKVNFEDNCATKALKEKLIVSSVTIYMDDYGSFEKVGGLGFDLPTCNEQITTEPCDIVLYQGNQLVIFYGTNSWSYTRIGKIIGL